MSRCKVEGCDGPVQNVIKYFASPDIDDEGYVYLVESKLGDVEFDVCSEHYLLLQSLVPTEKPAHKMGDPAPWSPHRRHELVKPLVRVKASDL